MAALDRTKEELGYFKFWQGVVVVTDISACGWLVSAAMGNSPLTVAFALAVLGVVSLTIFVTLIHREIVHCIRKIGQL